MMGIFNGWHTTKIVAPITVASADKVAEWLQGLQIDAAQVIVCRDDWATHASTNGTLIAANIDNGTMGAYIRFYNNSYGGNSVWLSNYNLAVDEGDNYTVFYR